MYAIYNNKLYGYLDDDYELLTYQNNKIDDGFEEDEGIYFKSITLDEIQDIFDVDFYVTYTDESETLKKAGNPSKWIVNEGRPLYKNPEIEKNELGLSLIQQSYSDDWVMDDKCSCSKIVDLYDCTDFTVVYTYIYRDGKELEEEIVEEVKVEAEEFKELMLKYRDENI